MDLRTGRDIALVLLIVEAFIVGLLPLAALYYAIRGMKELRSWLDPLIPAAQERLNRVARAAHTVGNGIVQPAIALSARRRQIQYTVRAVLRKPMHGRRPQSMVRSSPSTVEREAT